MAKDESSFESANSSNGSDESEDEEEILLPKALPQRSTRGRRMGSLMGEAAQKDKEFWEAEQWVEDANDEEWSTEDERHYRDEFDSDFDRGSTDEDEAEQAKAEEAEQRRLDREEAQLRKKKNVYQDPRALLKKGKTKSVVDMVKKARAAQAKRPKPPPPAVARAQVTRNLRIDKRPPIQEDLLAMAAKVEKENTASLQSQLEAESWKLAAKEQKQQAASLGFKGFTEVWVSWVPAKDDQDPVVTDTYFFMNIDRPDESNVPSIYLPPNNRLKPPNKPVYCSVYPNMLAKYRDPATGLPYSTIRAFLRLRRRTVVENVSKLSDKLLSLDTMLIKSFKLLNTHYKHDECAVAAVMNGAKSRENLLDERKRRKLLRSFIADADGGGSSSSAPSRPSSSPPDQTIVSAVDVSTVRPGRVANMITTPDDEVTSSSSAATVAAAAGDHMTAANHMAADQTAASIDQQLPEMKEDPYPAPPRRRGRPPKPRPSDDKGKQKRRKSSPSAFASIDPASTDWESLTAAFAVALRNQPGSNNSYRPPPPIMNETDAAAYWRGLAYAQWYQRPPPPPPAGGGGGHQAYQPIYGWQQQQQPATPYQVYPQYRPFTDPNVYIQGGMSPPGYQEVYSSAQYQQFQQYPQYGPYYTPYGQPIPQYQPLQQQQPQQPYSNYQQQDPPKSLDPTS